MIRHPFRKAVIAFAFLALAAGGASLLPFGRNSPGSSAEAASQLTARGGTGLPLPRFASLKSAKTNVRRGPGQDYDVAFTFTRSGLPVEIVQEFDTWRKIRDSEGQEGWVSHGLLVGRRTALVAPWETKGQVSAHRSADAASAVSAYLEPHVLTDVEKCSGTWCLVRGESYSGWIEQEKLWGVYPNEDVGS
jgi:SH3-like domain-containing protein